MMKIRHTENWLILNGLSLSLMTIKLINIHLPFIICSSTWMDTVNLISCFQNSIIFLWEGLRRSPASSEWHLTIFVFVLQLVKMMEVFCSILWKCYFYTEIIFIFTFDWKWWTILVVSKVYILDLTKVELIPQWDN